VNQAKKLDSSIQTHTAKHSFNKIIIGPNGQTHV